MFQRFAQVALNQNKSQASTGQESPKSGIPQLTSAAFPKPLSLDGCLQSMASGIINHRWHDVDRELCLLAQALAPGVSRIGNKELEKALNTPVRSGGATVLALAALCGAPKGLVDTLVSWGASTEVKISAAVCKSPDSELSLLHLACANGHFHLLPLLLQLGLDPNAKSAAGHFPFTTFLAAHRSGERYPAGLLRAAQMLHEHGCSFDRRDPAGKTALQYLAEQERWEVVQAILYLGPGGSQETKPSELTKPEVREIAADVVVSRKVNSATKPLLLDGLRSLFELARSVEQGEVVHTTLSTKLHTVLADAVFDPRGSNWNMCRTLLGELGRHRDLFGKENVSIALNTPYKRGNFSSTFLFRAVEGSAREVVEKLLDLGADPNRRSAAGVKYIDDPIDQVPLHVALRRNDFSMAEYLVGKGALLSAVAANEVRDTLLTNKRPESFILWDALAGRAALPPVHLLERALEHRRLFAAFFGEGGYEMLLRETFGTLRPSVQRQVAEKFPGVAAFEDLKPLTPESQVELAVEEVLLKLTRVPEMQEISERATSAVEILEACFALGYLKEALTLLKAGCPLPASYYGTRPLALLDTEEVQALRQEVITNTETLWAGFFRMATTSTTMSPIMAIKRQYANDVKDVAQTFAAHILELGGTVHDALKLANAISGFADAPWSSDPTGRHLAELLPQLLHRYPVTIGSDIVRWLEFGGSRYRDQSLKNLPEFFAFLLHPEITAEIAGGGRQNQLGLLTAGISSLTNFIGRNAEVTGSAVNSWRAIANIAYGHRRYRFDASRSYDVDEAGKRVVTAPSLFEEFGAKRLPHVDSNHPFHSGYAFFGAKYKGSSEHIKRYKALAAGDIMVRYRAGDVIFSPDLGYLFVRNSSLVFGRDVVPSVAYYVSPVDDNADILGRHRSRYERKKMARRENEYRSIRDMTGDILTLTPERLKRHGIPILHPALYSMDFPGPSSGISRVERLLEKHEAFEAAYRRFTFDTSLTSAWETDSLGNDVLVGAFNSRGFKHRVAFLRAAFDKARYQSLADEGEFTPPHALELYNPQLPPFVPYGRLVVDEEVLAILERISERGWESGQGGEESETETDQESAADRELSEEELSGVYTFMRLALRNQAELIVVPNRV